MASIKGSHHDDVLRGGGDDDRITGRSGDDVLRGRGGDDELHGGSGDDELFGGSGDDELFGGSGDDLLRGGSGDDELHGGSGDDELSGGSGDDELHGGSGDDELSGGSGDDELHGGSGDDELSGGSGDDELHGGSGDDELSGGSGDDELRGGSGDDELSGGSGDDELHGGSGDDELSGGAGDDILVGGEGDDVLTGGEGDDTFVFTEEGSSSVSTFAAASLAAAAVSGGDVITDFGPGDTIDLTGISSITGIEDLEIEQVGEHTVITLPNGQTITVENAEVAEVVAALEVPCLMRGAMVLTPKGEVPVETLKIGDEVMTIDGTAETVKWIGRRAYARPFVARGAGIAPIVFERGSLGPNVPSRPLYVSPEHAMYVDNVLVPARLLANGTTIRQVKDFDLVEYFHLEFDEAQVIVANGAPSESYVESGNRRMFANYGDYVELYGEAPAEASSRRRFHLVTGGAAVQAIHRRLSDRMAAA